MASYHCSIKPVSRGKGRSGIAAAAYRAGVCLSDERTGEVHNYTRREGVESAELVLPDGVNLDREQLWNAVENAEKRKDARVAREFELALPVELTPEQRRELATDFAKSLVDKYGVAADVAVHEPSQKGDQRNHHAHILITTRQIAAQGLGEKTDLEREDKALRAQGKSSGREQIAALRADWATRCNAALERAGHRERVDHRSLADQGVDREPTIHLGPAAAARERAGRETERGEINRERRRPAPAPVPTPEASARKADEEQEGEAERERSRREAQARKEQAQQEQEAFTERVRQWRERQAVQEEAQEEDPPQPQLPRPRLKGPRM